MIVYLARDIPAFVMYCVNGESGSSLLIESIDSMIKRRYKTFVGTLHCALENGADLYVNERHKIRHYRTRSTEERRRRIRRIIEWVYRLYK